MSSILRQSSSFSGNKIALVSQNSVEEASGLVTVNVGYVTSAANNDYWSGRFTLDSSPPIYPNIINRGMLQRGGLYMSSRSMSKQNGLVEINATYYGALNSARNGKNKEETTKVQTLQWAITFVPITSTFRSKVITYSAAITPNLTMRFAEPTKYELYVSTLFAKVYGNLALANPGGSATVPVTSQILSLALLNSKYLQVEKEEVNEVLTPSISVRTTRYGLSPIFQTA